MIASLFDDVTVTSDEPVLVAYVGQSVAADATPTVTDVAQEVDNLSALNMLHAFDDDTVIPLIVAGYEMEDKLVADGVLHADRTPYTVDTRGLRLTAENKLVVPRVKKVIRKVISVHHDHWIAGHFDHKRTIEKVRRRYYWLTMNADVLNYVQSCVICKLCSDHHPKTISLLEPLAVPEHSFESVSMDIIPKLSVHMLLPLVKGVTSKDITVMLQRAFIDFPRPTEIVTDNDPLFTAKVFKDFMSANNVTVHYSLPYRHQYDDPTGILDEFDFDDSMSNIRDNWFVCLPLIQYAINNTLSTSTGKTPYRIVFNRDAEPIRWKNAATPYSVTVHLRG